MQLSPMILSFTQLGEDRRPFHDSLAACRDAGYSEISLLVDPTGPVLRAGPPPSVSFIDVFRSDWALLRNTLAEHGLACRHLHAGGLDVTDMASATQSAAALSDFAVTAHNFGAEVMTFGIGPRLPEQIAWEDKVAYLDRAVGAFRQVHEALAGLPIRLGVDIHFRAPVETVRDALYVVDESGQQQVGLCLNTGHLRSSQEEGWQIIRQRPQSIVVLAYKDHTEAGSVHSLRLGAGDTPLAEYVDAVAESETSPYQVVSIEHEPWAEKDEAVAASRRYLEDLHARRDVREPIS